MVETHCSQSIDNRSDAGLPSSYSGHGLNRANTHRLSFRGDRQQLRMCAVIMSPRSASSFLIQQTEQEASLQTAITASMPMERMKSVEVIVRDHVGPIASGLVPDLIESFLDCSARWTIQKAACSGYLSLLKRLGEQNAEITDHGFDWSMRIAATEGYLDIIKWLTAYRPEMKISTRVMDAAALRGHLEVVKWLHENRSEGCSVHAMDSAAAGGHLDVVRWLHENRTEGCSTGAMDTAAAGGHLATVQWLWANRTEGCTTVAVDFAIYNGHFRVVKWFSELADFQPRTAKHTTRSSSSNGTNAYITKQPSGQATLAFD